MLFHPARWHKALLGGILALGTLLGSTAAQAQQHVRLLLDWSWLPYHAAFLIAKARGYYKDAGLDVDIEQGRGSATTAILLAQGGFDIAHLNVTNAAQIIGKGAPIKVVAIYQHESSASFVGIKGHVTLTGPTSLIGPKIGSTPGGSDELSLKIFTQENHILRDKLDIVSLDAQAKTAALFSGSIDVVSGDAPAFDAYVRATGQQPETLLLAKNGVPLIGFGFAANDAFLKAHPGAVTKFLAATRRGFVDEAKDPKAACTFMKTQVHLAGSVDRCADYIQGVMTLSTSPTDPSWGQQSDAEWQRLVSILKSVKEIDSSRPVSDYYTDALLPK